MKLIRSVGIIIAMMSASAATSSLASTLTTSDSKTFNFTSTLFDSDTGAGIQRVSDGTGGTDVFQPLLLLDQFDPILGTISGIEVTWRGNARRFNQSVSLVCRDSGVINSSCQDEGSSQFVNFFTQIDLPGLGGGLILGN